MKISIFGLGYVGCVTSVCLAKMGHEIIGVDVVDYKIDSINSGIIPIEEEGIHALMKKYHSRIKATKNIGYALINSDISFICVGTPPKPNGDMDFSAMEKTCLSIGEVLKIKKKPHTIIIRSTMFPGSFEIVKSILEQASGKKAGKDFFLLTNPEFLREGTAIKDFNNPPIIIIGAEKDTGSQKSAGRIVRMFSTIDCDKWIVSPNIAQMIKYVNNSWHGLKVCFANEIGALCHKMNIDSKLLMEIFCQDTQLNLSPYYLKPGFSYGGSCLKGNTLIHTADGMKEIKEINIGDKVYGYDGKTHIVTEKFRRKVRENMIKLKPHGMLEFSLTKEHPVLGVKRFAKWYNINGKKKLENNEITDWNPQWIPAEELQQGDYLVFPIFKGEKKLPDLNIPSKKMRRGLAYSCKVNNEFMRLLGYYLAEGSFEIGNKDHKERITFTFHEKETAYVEDISKIMKNLFNYKISNIIKKKGSKAICIRIGSSRVSKLIFGLCGHHSRRKKIAEKIMNLPPSIQKDLIIGMWRGDGCKTGGTWIWATASRNLYNQMKILLMRQQIAFSSRLTKEYTGKDGTHHHEAYYISIRNKSEVEKMNKLMNDFEINNILKQNIHKTIWIDSKRGYMYYPLHKSNKNFFEGYVYNLEVDKVHSYLCESATLHNCIPKEVAMFKNQMGKRGINSPIISSISKSNLVHIERAIQAIKDTGKKKIGILGISFKPGTNDWRGNPILLVINRLQTEGYNIKLWDPIIGKSGIESLDSSYRKEIFDLVNMENLMEKTHNISQLFSSEKEALKQDIIIIANRDKSFADCLKTLPKNKIVLDLQNIYSEKDTPAEYRNIV